MMTRRHQDILTRQRLLMVRSLKVTNVLLACLRVDYTLTDEMQQEIEAEKTNSDKAGTLLDILVRRGDKAFDRLIRAIVETDQDAIALTLDNGLAQQYISERDSCRMEVQQPSEPIDQSPGLSGGQPTPWHNMMVPAGGPQPYPPYGMVMMMPIMYPMQNMPHPYGGIMQPLPAANMTSTSGALVAHPSDVIMEGGKYSVGMTKPGSRLTYSPDELEAVLEEINGGDVKEIMDINLKAATNLDDTDDLMIYPMQSLPRGHAVIINNRYFVSKMQNRDGAQYDTENLKILFEKLSFTVIVRENLTAKQIYDLLTTESQHQDHAKSDAFVLFLLSHGSQGNIYGIDGEILSIEDDITTLFDPDHCPALNGKPKIFFIQACQGNLRTPRYTADSDKFEPAEMDESLLEKLKKLEIVDKEGFVPGFHKKSDVVMSYATVKGYIAWRRSDVGSWFVRCLVSVFSRRAHCKHLLDMLTEANFLMSKLQTSKREGNCVQLAEKMDTLIKELYFFPGSGSASKSEGSCEKKMD